MVQATAASEHPSKERSAEERALVEQAKAVLMERRGMTEAQAHRFLQKASMDAGVKLCQIAGWIVESR